MFPTTLQARILTLAILGVQNSEVYRPKTITTQECIPVGCVPAECWPYSGVWSRGGVRGGRWGCVCILKERQKSKKNSPPKKLGGPPLTPPKNWRPPGTDLQGMLGYPPGTDLQGMLGYPPPWDWLARHAGIPPGTDLQGMLGYPPCGQTDACKNITLAKTSFRPVKITLQGLRWFR